MFLQTAPGTRALIDVENGAPAAFFESLPGTTHPFWPQVRTEFMTAMQVVDFGSGDVGPEESSRFEAWRGLAVALLPSRAEARTLRRRRRILHLVAGGTVHRVGGRERNWLVGDHLEAFRDQSVLLQWRDPSGIAPAFEPTRSLGSAVTRSAAYARLSRGRRSETLRAIEPLVKEFARLLETPLSDERLALIAATAAYREASRPHVEKQVLRVVDRVRPSLIMMEDAAYGSWAPLIARFKERGIRVVEPQHGWVGPSHGAYNFGAVMAAPELAAGLPDELLTFGDFWSEGIRVPFTTTAIGKPHLEAVSAGATPWCERPLELLVVSSLAEPEAASEFVLRLVAALPKGWRVRFRPHPRERPTLSERYPRLLAHPHIEIDERHDVYESLGLARGVVGVASTVLFEALAMGCRVFVRDSVYAPYYVGDVFGPRLSDTDGVDVIVEGLSSGGEFSREMLEAIWKPHALANLRAWTVESLAA